MVVTGNWTAALALLVYPTYVVLFGDFVVYAFGYRRAQSALAAGSKNALTNFLFLN